MAETRPPTREKPETGSPGAGGFATFVGVLLASIGLNGLRDYLRRRRERRAEREAAEAQRQRQEQREAEIARKRALRHEPVGVRIRPLAGILAASVVFAAIFSVALWALLYVLATGAQQADAPLSPLATGQAPPPEPRLQVNPAADWQQVRATDEARLHSYGQGAGGAVRIPIERAIDLIAQRGLPARAVAPPASEYEQAHALESAGGQASNVTPAPLGQGSGQPFPTAAAQPTPTAGT